MTRYTVVWDTPAEDELIHLWIAATDRQDITLAADGIDQLLAVDPETKGMPLNGRRYLVVLPLAVTFAVYPDDRIVKVLQVWRDSSIGLSWN